MSAVRGREVVEECVTLGGGVSRPGGHPHVETIFFNQFFSAFFTIKKN